MLYSPQVEARFRAPRWAGGALSHNCRVGRATTPGSAAVLQISLQMDADHIQRASFLAYGCPACIAAADWACEWLSGRDINEIAQLNAAMIEATLELPPNKRHCGLLVEDALAAAVAGNSTHKDES